MQHDGKADIADFLRHRFANALPLACGTIQAINAAVILMIQTIRLQRVLYDEMRIVTEFNAGIR